MTLGSCLQPVPRGLSKDFISNLAMMAGTLREWSFEWRQDHKNHSDKKMVEFSLKPCLMVPEGSVLPHIKWPSSSACVIAVVDAEGMLRNSSPAKHWKRFTFWGGYIPGLYGFSNHRSQRFRFPPSQTGCDNGFLA